MAVPVVLGESPITTVAAIFVFSYGRWGLYYGESWTIPKARVFYGGEGLAEAEREFAGLVAGGMIVQLVTFSVGGKITMTEPGGGGSCQTG